MAVVLLTFLSAIGRRHSFLDPLGATSDSLRLPDEATSEHFMYCAHSYCEDCAFKLPNCL
jgi:hypothetical protein